ncbi:SurA N-terminal domain-containing protein [Shewanella surugensis]|uniref:Periplasmic chaperone PpiD n=1 Tax=Shewanella surugensis TaxID=212020 RepID=A0ABT0L8B5_9GAMM|nr:SurA N-terminal domain-containing protein [Shewanella surugensis]MCL1123938.1 SurA N-terminal domain-containing protein [Shewanella surugensis]
MLEKIREGSQGVIAKSILVLVILSFAFTGISSYLSSSTEEPAATVNGEIITQPALEQAYQNERARLQQQLGTMFDTLAANDSYMQSVKQNVLERLVADKLLDQSAVSLGLRVSDGQIKNAIMNEPAFQTDGKFDNDRYQAILRQLGYQAQTFRDMMRTDMTRTQLVRALVTSEFVLPSEAKYVAQLQDQTRDLRYLVVKSQPFLADVKVTDEQAQTYFDDNSAQFIRPESVSLDYVELDAKQMAKGITITDAQAKTYYDENKTQYRTAEKRLAAHILIEKGDDEVASKAKAEEIYKQLQAGANFAELAKKDSDDTFSREQGGKLDWFEEGVMQPTFDQALFSLKKGQYSTVLTTDFGFQIVKLLDIEGGQEVPFSDVETKIKDQLKEKQAVDKFYELQQTLADTSYEVPDTLSETAKAVDSKVETTARFTRNNVPPLFNQPDIVKAIFSANVLADGMNSDVLEVEPNHVVVLRAKTHTPAGSLPFADVKENIVAQLKQQQANEAARAKAQEVMTAVQNKESITDFTTKTNVTRNDPDVDNAIVKKAFQMPHSDSESVDTVALGSGYAVVILDKINAAKPADEAQLKALEEKLSSQYSEADYRAIIAMLKAQGEVTYPSVEQQ